MSVAESDIEILILMLQNQKLDLDLDLEVHKALGVRRTSMMYDCEVRVLLFMFFFFYHSALLGTPIEFSAFSAQEAMYRVKILTECQYNLKVIIKIVKLQYSE